jgi:DnaJ-class molecular chaperone
MDSYVGWKETKKCVFLLGVTILCGNQSVRSLDEIKTTPTNYYEFLRLPSTTASLKEIKQSYRRLAIELHPDKLAHNATEAERELCKEQFLFLQKIYETLSDPNERAIYDHETHFGLAVSNNNLPPLEEPRAGSKHFSVIRTPSMTINMQFNFPAMSLADLQIKTPVELKYAIDGGEKNISYLRRTLCTICFGKGVAAADIETCVHCHGLGYAWKKLKMEDYEQLTYSQCDYCVGKGYKLSSKRCVACSGFGYFYEDSWLMAPLQRGFDDGQEYIFESIGHQHRDGRRGDVKVTADYEFPAGYRVDGNSSDLLFVFNTSSDQLQQGLQFRFSYPTGETFEVEIPRDVTPGDVLSGYELRLDGLGLFKPKKSPMTMDDDSEELIINLAGYFDSDDLEEKTPTDNLYEELDRGDLVVKLDLNWTSVSATEVFETLRVSSCSSII